jgi:hypothetical protein
MALVLCRQCFAWVEPLGNQCPQCDYPLDVRTPDPSPQELGESIGRLVGRIGEVRIVRTALPDRGTLYETSNGLFFVPHRLEHARLGRGSAPRRRLRSFMAASLRAPLALFWTGPSRAGAARVEVAVDIPRPLEAHDSAELPHLLMRNPGVLFVHWRSIQHIRPSLWGWTVTRPNGLVLRLRPLGNRGSFGERMAAVATGGRVREAVCP